MGNPKLAHHRQLIHSTCVRLFPFIADRAVARSVTAAGSCTASSTVSSLMARCPPIRPSAVEMTPSTPSSPRPVPVSTCPAASTYLEPTVIDEVRTGTYRQLYHPEQL